MLAHLLADFDRPGAHDCALAWLHALFAARPQQGVAARADNAAAAGAQAATSPAGGPSAAGGTGSAGSAPAVVDAAPQRGGSVSAPPDSAAPSAYESVLLALLEGLRCRSSTAVAQSCTHHAAVCKWAQCGGCRCCTLIEYCRLLVGPSLGQCASLCVMAAVHRPRRPCSCRAYQRFQFLEHYTVVPAN